MNSDENRPNGIHVIEVLPQSEKVDEDLEAEIELQFFKAGMEPGTQEARHFRIGSLFGAEWQKVKDAKEIETMKKKYIVETIPATVSQIAMIREQTIREVSQILKDEAKSSTCKFANRADAKRISDYIKSKFLPKRKEQK